MVIKTSKEAYEFAQRAVQYFKSQQTKPIQEKKVINPISNDLRRKVCDIDYGKFDTLAEEFIREEEKETKTENDYTKALAGCAHDHSQERQLYEKSTEEKLKAAGRFRLEGNEAFRQKNFGLAGVHYRKALLQFDYTFPDKPEEEEWMSREKLLAHLNMAFCKINQKDWEEALIQCRLAIEIDPKNCKAFYRRGLVYLALDEYEKAEEAFSNAAIIEPYNTSVSEAQKQLERKKQQYTKKKRRVFTAMFNDTKAKEGSHNVPEEFIEQFDREKVFEKKQEHFGSEKCAQVSESSESAKKIDDMTVSEKLEGSNESNVSISTATRNVINVAGSTMEDPSFSRISAKNNKFENLRTQQNADIINSETNRKKPLHQELVPMTNQKNAWASQNKKYSNSYHIKPVRSKPIATQEEHPNFEDHFQGYSPDIHNNRKDSRQACVSEHSSSSSEIDTGSENYSSESRSIFQLCLSLAIVFSLLTVILSIALGSGFTVSQVSMNADTTEKSMVVDSMSSEEEDIMLQRAQKISVMSFDWRKSIQLFSFSVGTLQMIVLIVICVVGFLPTSYPFAITPSHCQPNRPQYRLYHAKQQLNEYRREPKRPHGHNASAHRITDPDEECEYSSRSGKYYNYDPPKQLHRKEILLEPNAKGGKKLSLEQGRCQSHSRGGVSQMHHRYNHNPKNITKRKRDATHGMSSNSYRQLEPVVPLQKLQENRLVSSHFISRENNDSSEAQISSGVAELTHPSSHFSSDSDFS